MGVIAREAPATGAKTPRTKASTEPVPLPLPKCKIQEFKSTVIISLLSSLYLYLLSPWSSFLSPAIYMVLLSVTCVSAF